MTGSTGLTCRLPSLLAQMVGGIALTGDVPVDVTAFLTHHGYPQTIEHSWRVAAEAERLATRFRASAAPAGLAGWLHDVSVVFPNSERVGAARELGLEVLPEEENAPIILHQKLSAVVARDVFCVEDEAVLSAIACHTTLKAGASALDKVVFIADKVRWDQPQAPPFLEAVLTGLERSLDEGVLAYLVYIWEQRHTLRAVHPWLAEAYAELSQAVTRG